MNGEAKKDAVRAELEYLAARNMFTADHVVRRARKEDNPLHGYFEWDDTVAAQKYRIVQARRLIERVRIPMTEETRIVLAPFAVRDPDADTGQQGYVRTATVKNDREKARGVMLSEIARAESYMTRIQSLALALGLESEVADITARFEALKERVAA